MANNFFSTNDAYAELLDYLRSYDLEPTLKETTLTKKFTKAFKKYYPLMVLFKELERVSIWKDKDKSDNFQLYMRETVSDICQTLFLGLQGMYKPSNLCLRSSIENFVRCLGLAEDQAVLSLKSVFELMDLVADTKLIKNDSQAKKCFQTLKQEYADLCGYVHTSTSAHMALTTVVGHFPKFVEKDAEQLSDTLSTVCSNMTALLILICPKQFLKMHHNRRDIVSDTLSKSFKRHLNR